MIAEEATCPEIEEKSCPGILCMVVPVGTSQQEIVVVNKTPSGATEQRTIEVRFVPMVSKPPSTKD